MPKRGSDELLGLLMNPYPYPSVADTASRAARLKVAEKNDTFPTAGGTLTYKTGTPRMVKSKAATPPPKPPPGVSPDVKSRNDRRGQAREAKRQGYMK